LNHYSETEHEKIKKCKSLIRELKQSEEQLEQDIFDLNTKLSEEQQKCRHNERMLQLRIEYVNTLEASDEVNKLRMQQQSKEIGALKFQIAQLKSGADEELTRAVKRQELRIKCLEKELKANKKKNKLVEQNCGKNGDGDN
jgi:chromosome segregation ATPase